MKRHFKSCVPALNVCSLKEMFTTDTFFSSVKAIGGVTCAQVYVGMKSGYTRLYGMTSESEFKYSLQDYIRDTGAPPLLKSDNASTELSKDIVTLCRMYKIVQPTSKPHNQWQNPAECRIQEIKAATNALMDSTNGGIIFVLLF